MATIKTLLDLLDKFTPEVRKAFFEAIADIRDNITIQKVVDAIAQGDITAAIDAMGLEPAAFRPLTRSIETAFEQGGIFTTSQFRKPVTGAVFRFDVRNSRAEAYLRDQSSTLVTNITNEQIDIIRGVLQEGVAAGTGPRNLALDIVGRIDPITGNRTGGVIGLNKPQANALARSKRELQDLDSNYFTRELRDKRFDSVVQKAIDSGTPLPSDYVDKLTNRYSDNLLKWRGETIARDQTLTALNKSQQESVAQIIDTGAVDQQDIKREWDSAGDNRTRESHREMDGQIVGPDEAFTTPDGDKLMFPGDNSLGAPPEETINCRCRVKLNIDWLRKAKGNE